MSSHCLNCNIHLKGDYCSKCGQSSKTHKISLPFLLHDVQHGLLHVDKGFLYTAKELFIRPGHSIREFIEGKRVKHFKPVSLVIILASFYSLLSDHSHINVLANIVTIEGSGEMVNKIRNTYASIGNWLSQHFAIVSLLTIPLFAFITYLSFKKVKYNFAEHFIVHTFLTGQRLIFHILIFPIYYIYSSPSSIRYAEIITNFIGISFSFWALFQLFSKVPPLERIARIILSLVIFFVIVLGILISITKYVHASVY